MFRTKLALSAAVAVALLSVQPAQGSTPAQGGVTSLYHSGSGFNMSGWTLDPAAPSYTTRFRVRLDGKVVVSAPTATVSPTVNADFHTSGRHGFATHIPVPLGDHTLCIDGLTVMGVPAVLACYDFEVQS